MSIISKSNCPVPFDQQPLNEYLELKKSWLFSWSSYKINKYIITIFCIFLFLFLFIGFLISYTFFNVFSIWKLCILNFLICDVILFFVLMRVYLGWSYLIKRLMSAIIFYEESGWYDGQNWIKTSEYLIQDRLIGIYQIMPLISRIKCTCLVILFIFIIEYSFFIFFE
uniref:Ycf36 n=1 Tax=Bostrychia simpliciuscula TaxID=324754 RepID=A0A1Z1M882_9FLOR|nr:hypothetical protein [Bostrychia simpliciuscula]ARW62103.1 hypothetical protein [Bostrychia simpliciuscula]